MVVLFTRQTGGTIALRLCAPIQARGLWWSRKSNLFVELCPGISTWIHQRIGCSQPVQIPTRSLYSMSMRRLESYDSNRRALSTSLGRSVLFLADEGDGRNVEEPDAVSIHMLFFQSACRAFSIAPSSWLSLRRLMSFVLLHAFLMGAGPIVSSAADSAPAASAKIDFNRDIRPILSNQCIACHGPDEHERKAGLRLDTHDGAIEDLGGYAALVPGNPGASELLTRLTIDDEEERMPPRSKGERLKPEQIERIRRWIEQGGDYDVHWAYSPPAKSPLPDVEDRSWPVNEIDRFILARLGREGLQPRPEADRKTLARRVALDLTWVATGLGRGRGVGAGFDSIGL